MENNSQTQYTPTKSSNKKTVGLLIVAMLALLITGLGVYYWQQGKVKELNIQADKSKSEVADLNKKITSLESKQKSSSKPNYTSVASVSEDEKVLAAAENYCEAGVGPDQKSLVFKPGTAGEAQKRILYSADKQFAYVNARCDEAAYINEPGSGAAYYLKKVNNAWIFLYRGQMSDPDQSKLFNIPSDFK